MSKAAEAFRTISEVADLLDVPKHVLRFWEAKFPQIRPMKRGGGRRYYRPEDMTLLCGIRHLLHAQGYTIKGVQKILREQGVEQVKVQGAAEQALLSSKPSRAGSASPSASDTPKPSAASTTLKKARMGRKLQTSRSSAAPFEKEPASGRPASSTTATNPQWDAVEKLKRTALLAAVAELEACRNLLVVTAKEALPPQPAPAQSAKPRAQRTSR